MTRGINCETIQPKDKKPLLMDIVACTHLHRHHIYQHQNIIMSWLWKPGSGRKECGRICYGPAAPQDQHHFFDTLLFSIIFWHTSIQHYFLTPFTIQHHHNHPECDVPVPEIPGTRNFSFFWWYRKKYRYRYRKYLVLEMSNGIGIVWHFGYRHTLNCIKMLRYIHSK